VVNRCRGQFGPLQNLQRVLGDKMVFVGVLSWTRGDGVAITRSHAKNYGMTFPLWHGGPVTPMTQWSPTTIIFDKSGSAVAWARGDYHFGNGGIQTLLEALAK
jgi:hypothetical protein